MCFFEEWNKIKKFGIPQGTQDIPTFIMISNFYQNAYPCIGRMFEN